MVFGRGELVRIERTAGGARQRLHRDPCHRPLEQPGEAPPVAEAAPTEWAEPEHPHFRPASDLTVENVRAEDDDRDDGSGHLDDDDEVLDDGELIRQALTILLAGTRSQRQVDILRRRLGLSGDGGQTLAEIALAYSLSRERIRQLEAQGLLRLTQATQAPTPSPLDPYGWHPIRDWLRRKLDASPDAGWLLARVRAAFPDAAPTVALRATLVLAGCKKPEREIWESQVALEERIHEAARKRAARDARTSLRLDLVLSDADWPEAGAVAQQVESWLPNRQVSDTEVSGSMFSDKLGRPVAFESGLEQEFLVLLERSDAVVRYCEQVGPIPYNFQGTIWQYFPDALLELRDGRILLVEIKPLAHMALARNLAKVAAARSYTHARGWGFVMTSGRRSLRRLESHLVDGDLACMYVTLSIAPKAACGVTFASCGTRQRCRRSTSAR